MSLSPCKSATDRQSRELVRHGAPPFPIACYRHGRETVNTVPWHWHDELEAVLVAEGRVSVSAEGETRRLEAGEGCFFTAGALHCVWQEETGPVLVHSLVFHPRLVGGSVESVFWQNYLRPLLSGAACGFQEMSYFARTFRALKGETPSQYRAARSAPST